MTKSYCSSWTGRHTFSLSLLLVLLLCSLVSVSLSQPIPLNSSSFIDGQISVPYQIDQYTLFVPPSDPNRVHQIRISLTSWVGDAELFVTTQGPVTNTTWMWRGYDSGTTSIVIFQNDTGWCDNCTYYVGVYPHESIAWYRIAATAYGNSSYWYLAARKPAQILTPTNDFQNLVYQVVDRDASDQHGIRIAVTPAWGYVVLFVSVISSSDPNISSFPFPTPYNYTWMGHTRWAGSYLHILRNDTNFCAGPVGTCYYLISLYTGFNHSSQYNILVTQGVLNGTNSDNPPAVDQHIQLTNQVPLLRFIDVNQTQYYLSAFLGQGSNFYVTLTRLSGFCSMYISYQVAGQNQYPNSTNNDWSSRTRGNTLTFETIAGPMRSPFDPIYIAVEASSFSNCSFTIVAAQQPVSDRPGRWLTRVTDGIPQFDSLNTVDSWRYYVFYLIVNDSLTFSVTKVMGDVEVYISGGRFNWYDNYTTSVVPNATNYDVGLTDHGLTTYNFKNVSQGRYVIAVHATQRADYYFSITATYTDQILVEGVPANGYIRPAVDPWGGWANSSRYIYILDYIYNASQSLTFALTTLSGHVDIYVSDTEPGFINPMDPTTYNWTQTNGTRLSQITIPGSSLHIGPYFVLIVASQDSTYHLLGSFFDNGWSMLQSGIPQDNWLSNQTSHWYSLVVPGGFQAHDVFLSLVPLVGRANLYVANVTTTFKWPSHLNTSSYDFRGDYPYSAIHQVYLPNFNCSALRCMYLIEVWAYSMDTRYNLLAYSWNSTDVNNETYVIQHTVPQLAFTPGIFGFDGQPRTTVSHTHLTFHIPQDNSTVSLAITPQGANAFTDLRFGISRFKFPENPLGSDSERGWFYPVNLHPVWFVNGNDPNFYPSPFTNRTQKGVYYLTIWNWGVDHTYTVALSVRDMQSRWTNDSSVILINQLPQIGFAPDPYFESYRMWQLFNDTQIHVALSEDVLLYHSTNVSRPGPMSGYESYKNSRVDTEWLEYPFVPGVHYFSVTALRGNFRVRPTRQRGQNDTTVVNYLWWGETISGRAVNGSMVHYEFYVGDNSTTWIEVRIDIVSGNPHAYINYGPYVNSNGWETYCTFPSYGNAMWNITDPFFPYAYILQPLQGRYLITVLPAYSAGTQAEWRISVIRHMSFPLFGNISDSIRLIDGQTRQSFVQANDSNLYFFQVPEDNGMYQELRIALTSWYGDSELFVSTLYYSPNYVNYTWRGYDAGTTTLIINNTDDNWMIGAKYWISVWSNQASSYYSLTATIYMERAQVKIYNHLPINMKTPVNSTQRFSYRPLNYQLTHGFRINLSPAYGAATFAVNVIDTSVAQNFNDWKWPNGTNATWNSMGMFEGTFLHIHHTDPGWCTSNSSMGDDAESRCMYLIVVTEATGFVPCEYTLLLSSIVTPDLLPSTNVSNYIMFDFLRAPHTRLINHRPIQQYGEGGNITYYKTINLNPNTLSYVTLTVLSGWADIYISDSNFYPSSVNGTFWFNSRLANTTSVSYYVGQQWSFMAQFIAIETHINTTYTIVAGQYSVNRLGRFPLVLTNGIPQYDSLADFDNTFNQSISPALHHWRYYVYYLPVDIDFFIVINKFMGEVEAYISYQPILPSNNASYSMYPIPDNTTFDRALDSHGLNAMHYQAAKAGRYLIGVHAHRLADYQISTTAWLTHTVLTKDVPFAGYIKPWTTPTGWVYNVSRYLMYLAQVPQTDLVIAVTQLSGHVRVYYSDFNPGIDPNDPTTYNASTTGTRLDQIVIPQALLRQGPYWIHVRAFQNSTFQVLATDFMFTSLQLGLPNTVFAPNGSGHVYILELPGAWSAQTFMINVIPLFGRAWVYGFDISYNFNYPNHTNHSFMAANPWTKPQFLPLDTSFCFNIRCTYLIDVWAPFSDTLYTINVLPISTLDAGNTTLMLQHTVPQTGVSMNIINNQTGMLEQGQTHFIFHIPEDNSTATLSFTILEQSAMAPDHRAGVVVAVSRWAFPLTPYPPWDPQQPDPYTEWIFFGQNSPVIVIDAMDPIFTAPYYPPPNNRTQAGVYFVTVFAVDQPLFFSLAVAIKDNQSMYTNDSSILLVDTLPQVGYAPFDSPTNYTHRTTSYYRMYHQFPNQSIHVKMTENVQLYTSLNITYPSYYNGYDEYKNAAIQSEWIEYPSVPGWHYFGVLNEAFPASHAGGGVVPRPGQPGDPFYLLPYLFDGLNATNVRQRLVPGMSRQGRLLPNATMYFNFYIDDREQMLNPIDLVRLSVTTTDGSFPMVWVNWGVRVPNIVYFQTNTTYPSWMNYQWTINSTDIPFVRITPIVPGEYLIAVHSYHTEESSFTIKYQPHYVNGSIIDPEPLSPQVVTINMADANTTDWYELWVPGTDYRTEIAIQLTSWYGNSEFFVCNTPGCYYSPFTWTWRGYDAGSASVIIRPDPSLNQSDPYCRDCSYYIGVYANEVQSLYSLTASLFTFHRSGSAVFQVPADPVALSNHLPMNFIVGNTAHQHFYFVPKNYQLRHSLRIHTSPTSGWANFTVKSVQKSQVVGLLNSYFPRYTGDGMDSYAVGSGSGLHIHTYDPIACNASNWGNDDNDSGCIYLISVFGPLPYLCPGFRPCAAGDVQFTIEVSTFTPQSELPPADRNNLEFQAREPHVRLLNNIPLLEAQYGNTTVYYKAYTNIPDTETVITLTAISGWADMYIDNVAVYPNQTANFWNSHDTNVSTIQFKVNATYAYTELFIAVMAWTNVSYTITLSQYPMRRLGRFPIRLMDGLPQADTVAEYDDANAYALSHWRYYVYYLARNESLTVVLNKFMGELEAYINWSPIPMGNNNYTYTDAVIPNNTFFNHSIQDHGLMVWNLPSAPPGRYVIGVFSANRTDYAISITSSHADNVLLQDVPTTGYLKPIPQGACNFTCSFAVARYVLILPDAYQDRDLFIGATEYSGHVSVFYSTVGPDIRPWDNTTFNASVVSNSSVRLDPLWIPASQVQQGFYWISVYSLNNATFSIMATNYWFAEIQMGLPTNSWIMPGDSHVYGIVVPGWLRAHDFYVTSVPLMGRTSLWGSNCTAGWKRPNHTDPTTIDFQQDSNYNAVNILYIPNFNCVRSKRCIYLIEVHCHGAEGTPCRYGLTAFSWDPLAVANTSVVLQNSVPQVGFTGLTRSFNGNLTNSRSHFIFHVPSEYSNVSLFFTQWQGDFTIAMSRYQYPNFRPGFDAEWMALPNEPIIYTDYTSPRFNGSSPNGRLQAGVYYVTVFNDSPDFALNVAWYTLTLSIVDNSTRGTNASAIFLVDGQPQFGYMNKQQESLLYAFVAPYINTSLSTTTNQSRAVYLTYNGRSSALADLFITWDGSVPSPSNYQQNRTADDPNDIYIMPSRSNCDRTQQDCIFLIAAYNRISETKYDNAFVLTASGGSAFTELTDGVSTVGTAFRYQPQNYSFMVNTPIPFNSSFNYNWELTVSIQPSRLFCGVAAYVANKGYPDPATALGTNFMLGVSTLHLSRPAAGLWAIVVYARSDACDFTITVTTGAVALTSGDPFADYLPVNQGFDSWRRYTYIAEDINMNNTVIFQVQPLATDSKVSFCVPEGRDICRYNSTTNSTWDNPGVIAIAPADAWRNFTRREWTIWVNCAAAGSGYCTYELTAQFGTSIRLLLDGQTIRSPVGLRQGQWAYYKAYARPDQLMQRPLSLTVSKLTGQVAVYAGFDPRPGPDSSYLKNSSIIGDQRGTLLLIDFATLVNDSRVHGYIYISVQGTGSDLAQYTITASLSATYILESMPVIAYCAPGLDAYFMLNLDAIHTVEFLVLEKRPDFVHGQPNSLSLTVFDSNMTRFSNPWHFFDVNENSTAVISRYDSQLMACVNSRRCTLFMNVSGCLNSTVFTFLAQAGDRPERLSANDRRMVSVENPNPLTYKVHRFYAIYIDAPQQLTITAEQCVGQTFWYLWYSTTAADPANVDRYPDNNYNDDESELANAIQTKTIKNTAYLIPDKPLKLTVVSQSPGSNSYIISTSTFDNGSNVNPVILNPILSANPGVEKVDLSWQLDENVNVSDVYYTLYSDDGTLGPSAFMFSRCGLDRAKREKVWTGNDLNELAQNEGTYPTVTYSLTSLDSSKTYVFQVLVEFRGRFGWAVYNAAPNIHPLAPNNNGGGGMSDSSGPIILGVVLPITLILAGIAFYLYIRNRRLKQELSVELPDVSTTPSSAAARRRAQRGADVGSDSFNRGGGDMYSSLLGEDEAAAAAGTAAAAAGSTINGDEDKSSRTSRRGKKAPARAKSPQHEETLNESDVAYRNDVI